MPLNPQTAALVEAMAAEPAPQTHELDPSEARLGYRALADNMGPGPDVATEDRSIPLVHRLLSIQRIHYGTNCHMYHSRPCFPPKYFRRCNTELPSLEV